MPAVDPGAGEIVHAGEARQRQQRFWGNGIITHALLGSPEPRKVAEIWRGIWTFKAENTMEIDRLKMDNVS